MAKSFEVILSPENYFRLGDGKFLKDLHELRDALKAMGSSTFAFHVNSEKNDFGNWVRDIFRDEELANALFSSATREEMVRQLELRLAAGQDDKSYPEIIKVLEEEGEKPRKKHSRSEKIAQEHTQTWHSAKEFPKEPEEEAPAFRHDASLEKIDEILLKEKEIEKREEKIQEIEQRMEKELSLLAAKKDPKFFTKEFSQGVLIGLLVASIAWLVYVKYIY